MHTMTTTFRTLALGALLAIGATALAQSPHGAGHGHGVPNTQDTTTGMGMGPGGVMGAAMPMTSRATGEAEAVEGAFLEHMVMHHMMAVRDPRMLDAAGVGMHGAHDHRGATVATVGAEGAARLAQAFLDGRGDGAVTDVEEPVVTFEVRFDDADGGGVLIVDAHTGTVRVATER